MLKVDYNCKNIDWFNKEINGLKVNEIINDNSDTIYKTVNSMCKITNNRATYKRGNKYVYEILRFFIDLDIYNSNWFNSNSRINRILDELDKELSNLHQLLPQVHSIVIDELLKFNDKLGLPPISEIMFSGRGYYIFWNIKPKNKPSEEQIAKGMKQFYGVPKHLIKSYELCEKELVTLFKKYGADSKATAPAQLLKVENTQHPKTFLLTEIVYSKNNYYYFEEMADVILKYTYNEIKQYKTSFQPLTKKQLKILMTKDFDELNIDIFSLSKAEASKLINNQLRTKHKVDNLNYIIELLDKLLSLDLITKGHRNLYCYFYGIGLKRKYKKGDVPSSVIDIAILNISSKIKLDKKETTSSIESGINADTDRLSKKYILNQLSITEENKKYILKKKYTRSTKETVVFVKQKMILNWKIDKKLSVRKLEFKYKISKSKVSNIKREIKAFKKANKMALNEYVALSVVGTTNKLSSSVHKINENVPNYEKQGDFGRGSPI